MIPSLKFSTDIEESIREAGIRANFIEEKQPYAGVHVRSTDKGNEAVIRPPVLYQETMKSVCKIYDHHICQQLQQQNVWIATDSSDNVEQFQVQVALH